MTQRLSTQCRIKVASKLWGDGADPSRSTMEILRYKADRQGRVTIRAHKLAEIVGVTLERQHRVIEHLEKFGLLIVEQSGGTLVIQLTAAAAPRPATPAEQDLIVRDAARRIPITSIATRHRLPYGTVIATLDRLGLLSKAGALT